MYVCVFGDVILTLCIWLRNRVSSYKKNIDIYIHTHHISNLPLGETKTVTTMFPHLCKGIVVKMDMTLSPTLVSEALDQHILACANTGVVLSGVRFSIAHDADKFAFFVPPRVAFSPHVQANLRVLNDKTIGSMDVWAFHSQVCVFWVF